MIKSILKILFIFSSVMFFFSCDTEDIVEIITGEDMMWYCVSSEMIFNEVDWCQGQCNEACIGYQEAELEWQCENSEEIFEDLADCLEECEGNCSVIAP